MYVHAHCPTNKWDAMSLCLCPHSWARVWPCGVRGSPVFNSTFKIVLKKSTHSQEQGRLKPKKSDLHLFLAPSFRAEATHYLNVLVIVCPKWEGTNASWLRSVSLHCQSDAGWLSGIGLGLNSLTLRCMWAHISHRLGEKPQTERWGHLGLEGSKKSRKS